MDSTHSALQERSDNCRNYIKTDILRTVSEGEED